MSDENGRKYSHKVEYTGHNVLPDGSYDELSARLSSGRGVQVIMPAGMTYEECREVAAEVEELLASVRSLLHPPPNPSAHIQVAQDIVNSVFDAEQDRKMIARMWRDRRGSGPHPQLDMACMTALLSLADKTEGFMETMAQVVGNLCLDGELVMTKDAMLLLASRASAVAGFAKDGLDSLRDRFGGKSS